EHCLPELHRCANAHAKHVRHRPQQINRAPATDQDVPFRCKRENFLRSAARHALAIHSPPFKQRGLTFEKTEYFTFRQTRAFNDIVFDKLVVHDVKPEPLSEPGSNILTESGHFARHRYNGHDDLPGINSLRPAPFASDLPMYNPISCKGGGLAA